METLRPESFEILASEDSADSRILTVALRTVNVAATETHSGEVDRLRDPTRRVAPGHSDTAGSHVEYELPQASQHLKQLI